MIRIDTYLNFNGHTEEAFNHYRKIFGTSFTTLMRFGEMPGSEKMAEQDRQKIMHVALPIGNNVLMGTDALESMNQRLTPGDNFSISITLDDEKEARRIFEALSEGGTVTMPLGKEFWSTLFGMCSDKYGIQWVVNYNEPGK